MAYAGHQFGHPAVLGDGRAHLLGEQVRPDGRRFDIQLKGSGRTPYGARGDGRAVLGPMLREYLISEAMQALGVPTTRSLAVVASGETVLRHRALPGAILTRVAASHLRFGSFEWHAIRGDDEGLRRLFEYAVARHDPALAGADDACRRWLVEVARRQAALICEWIRVGFVHGVMNTDNMTISGEAIDYGPCAFMDAYHPETVFSSIDAAGRYAFGNQAPIAVWNFARLCEAMLPLLDRNPERAVAIAEELVEGMRVGLEEGWLAMMRGKLGLFGSEPADRALIDELLGWMQREKADYTRTFHDLSVEPIPDLPARCKPDFRDWHARWRARLERGAHPPAACRKGMATRNPALIPRNHRVEEALARAEEGEMAQFDGLLDSLSDPYRAGDDPLGLANAPPIERQAYRTYCGT